MYRKGFDDFYAEYSVMNVLSMMESDENLWYPLINPSQYKRALEEFVKKLPMKDVNFILSSAKKMNEKIGLDNTIIARCSECGYDIVTPFLITSEFLEPTN